MGVLANIVEKMGLGRSGRRKPLYEPISLGPQCETKFQLCRVRYEREAESDAPPFSSLEMLRGAHEKRFTTHIFDAQTTPFFAIEAYLRDDFQGAFEREDFTIDGGEPYHRRLGTRHPHEFPAAGDALAEADIEAHYATAYSRFEHLAAKFRRHLLQPGPFLYVLRETRPTEDLARLMEQLSARSPLHAFHLLVVDYEDKIQSVDNLPDVSIAGLTRHIDKPAHRLWEGNDEAWDKVLAPFSFASTRSLASS
jgi:hypothetical protein